MPISGPSSYLSTVEEFLSHWEEANSGLGAGQELAIAEGMTRDVLADERDLLEQSRDAVTDARMDRALARAELDQKIERLQARMVEFNGRIRADLPSHAIARVLPAAFAIGDAESTVREGLRQISRLWLKVQGLPPATPGLTLPMLLRGAYTLALFDADRAALRVAYQALTDADVELRVAREMRNDVQDRVYAILKNYRLKVPTAFAPGHAMVTTLPALTPGTGRTPAAVAAQAAWNAPTNEAKVTWAASDDADLQEYEVRGVSGDDYNTDDEAVIGTIAPGAPREVSTAFGLGQPGLTAGYKVYVVLKSGHEKGSDAVYVTRPTG